jgi:hypothetical protein
MKRIILLVLLTSCHRAPPEMLTDGGVKVTTTASPVTKASSTDDSQIPCRTLCRLERRPKHNCDMMCKDTDAN